MARKKPPDSEPGCCSCIGRVMCAIVLAPSFVAIIGLSVAAMSGGRSVNWLRYQQMQPPYTLQAGYDGFIVYNQFGVQTAEKLRTIWTPFWILGIVSVGLLGLSVLIALALFLATMSGFAGKYMVCLSIPMGITTWVAVIGYLVVGIIRIRSYTQSTAGTSFAYTPVPDWGWICAFCVGMLWLWCAAWSGVIPRKVRHYDDEEYAPQAPPRAQKLGYVTDPTTPPPAAGPMQSHRGWRGLQEQAPGDVPGLASPGGANAGVVVSPASPVQASGPPEQKKGVFGFGRKKGNEVELASEEFRAPPFTDTVEPEAAQGPDGGPVSPSTTKEVSGGAGSPPPFESTMGAWNPPTGEQPSWVGAPEPEPLHPKSKGLLGAFRK